MSQEWLVHENHNKLPEWPNPIRFQLAALVSYFLVVPLQDKHALFKMKHLYILPFSFCRRHFVFFCATFMFSCTVNKKKHLRILLFLEYLILRLQNITFVIYLANNQNLPFVSPPGLTLSQCWHIPAEHQSLEMQLSGWASSLLS